MKRFSKLNLGAIALAGSAVSAMADDAANAAALTAGFSVDTSPIFIVAGVVIAAIGSIWAIKKLISIGNKS